MADAAARGTVQATAITAIGDAAHVDDIVLVDDEPMIGEFVRRVLRGSGRRLLVFRDPFEALEHLLVHEPRILLVDTRMPTLDGPELLTRLVAHGRLLDTRVILCSATRHNTTGEPPAELARLEWVPKDELFDRHTLLERLGGGAAERAGRRVRAGSDPGAQPSSAAESSGRASNRSATSP